MRIGISDLRDWGFKKISKFFELDSSLDSILNFSAINMDKKMTAYGFPAEWKKEHTDSYKGMSMLMYHVEPMIDNIEPDDICKRKFRNTYDSIIESFCSCINVSNGSIFSFHHLGLRLPFINSAPSSIYNLYTCILIWGILTKSESTMDSMNLSIEFLINNLVTMDTDEFIDFVLGL